MKLKGTKKYGSNQKNISRLHSTVAVLPSLHRSSLHHPNFHAAASPPLQTKGAQQDALRESQLSSIETQATDDTAADDAPLPPHC